MFLTDFHATMVGMVQDFGIYINLLSFQELDEKVDTTLNVCPVNMKLYSMAS